MESKFFKTGYLLFFILLPLISFSNLVDFVLIPRQIFLAIFLLILILFIKNSKIEIIPFKEPIYIAFFIFIFLNLISFKQANVISESHAFFAKIVILFVFFFVTCTLLINKIISVSTIVICVVLFAFIANVIALVQVIEKTNNGQHLTASIGSITGNFANKNLLSSVLFLCIPFLFLGLNESKKINYVSIITLFSTFFILILVRTRVVLIASLVFFILIMAFMLFEKYKIKLKYLIVTTIAFFILSFSGFYYFLQKQNLKSTTINGYLDQYFYRLLDSETLKTRVLFWKNSIEIFKENWFFGVGLGNWQLVFPKIGLDNFKALDDVVNGETTLQRPHNDFIWILCETGILGLFAYLFIFGLLFYQLIYLIKNTVSTSKKRNYYYLFSGLAGYIVISFFDFPYERIEHQVILMVLFSIITFKFYNLKNQNLTLKSNTNVQFILLIPIVYTLIVSYNRFNGELHTSKMYIAKNNKNWSGLITESQKAKNYFYQLDNASIPISWYEGIGHFNSKNIQESEDCFYAAYQLNPYNIYVINNLASAYQVNGKTNEAIDLYKLALQISKNFDEAKLNLAALYFNKKEFNNAFLTIDNVNVTTKNVKYKTYLIPILNNAINTFLKESANKNLIALLVKKVTTSDALLELYFDSKKSKMNFETYLNSLDSKN